MQTGRFADVIGCPAINRGAGGIPEIRSSEGVA